MPAVEDRCYQNFNEIRQHWCRPAGRNTVLEKIVPVIYRESDTRSLHVTRDC